MRTIQFIGNITTVQPVNISIPNVKGMPKSQGLPMIPASSVRGHLRHSAHEGVTALLAKQDKMLTVDEHYLLASGVDTARSLGTSGQNTKVGSNIAIREMNPLLSLWGYWGLSGRFSVGNAVSTSESALLKAGGGSRQHVFNRNEKLHLFVDPSELPRLQDILNADKYSAEAIADYKAETKLLKSGLRGKDADEKIADNNRIAELAELIREAKDLRVGASETIQRPLESFESIDQGQMLPHRMTLKSPTDIELELALWSIAMASIKPYIGGHTNANFGEISCEWDVFVTDIDNFKPRKLGHVGFNSQEGFFCTIEGFDADDVSSRISDGTINVVPSLP